VRNLISVGFGFLKKFLKKFGKKWKSQSLESVAGATPFWLDGTLLNAMSLAAIHV